MMYNLLTIRLHNIVSIAIIIIPYRNFPNAFYSLSLDYYRYIRCSHLFSSYFTPIILLLVIDVLRHVAKFRRTCEEDFIYADNAGYIVAKWEDFVDIVRVPPALGPSILLLSCRYLSLSRLTCCSLIRGFLGTRAQETTVR